MDSAALIRRARTGAGLSLRRLAELAGTSHATIAAYEAGRVHPSGPTVERIIRAAGFRTVTELVPTGDQAGLRRSEELVQALELAAQFPARHRPELRFPRFPTR